MLHCLVLFKRKKRSDLNVCEGYVISLQVLHVCRNALVSEESC